MAYPAMLKGEDPDAVVANAKRVLNRAWALLED